MSERLRKTVYSDPDPFDPDQVWGPDDDPTIAGGVIMGKKTYHYVELPNKAGPDLRVKLPTQSVLVEIHNPDGTITYERYDVEKHGELADHNQTNKGHFNPEFGDEKKYKDAW